MPSRMKGNDVPNPPANVPIKLTIREQKGGERKDALLPPFFSFL